MASTSKGVLDQVVTQIQAVNGTGGYAFNLSATGTVQRCGDLRNGPPLCVCIWAGELRTEVGPQLSRYTNELDIEIMARTPTSEGASAREDASLNLTDEILRALHADRTLGSRVADVRARAIQIDGAELGIPGSAVTYIRATAKWLSSSGV